MSRIVFRVAAYGVIAVGFWAVVWGSGAIFSDDYAEARQRMVENQLVRAVPGRPAVTDAAVLRAMGKVPRDRFVPSSIRKHAYRDGPLPIGEGQTISQPYIVASMTAALTLERDDTVLEIGTGSGYQAAVLAEIVKAVYTIEIVPALGKRAAELLRLLGYENIYTRIGDGYVGWPEHAPFDAIIVTAAPDHVPAPLVEQLKPGGKIVIPVGPRGRTQKLMLLEKQEDGSVKEHFLELVRFVPLTRDKQAEN